MVCRGHARRVFYFAAQQRGTTGSLTSVGQSRLRAFSYGYRVRPHPYRSGLTKKREVGSVASAADLVRGLLRRTRFRVGSLSRPDAHGFHRRKLGDGDDW